MYTLSLQVHVHMKETTNWNGITKVYKKTKKIMPVCPGQIQT